MKGNECVKVKEYDEAFKEYSQSIRIKPSAASFNNRAMISEFNTNDEAVLIYLLFYRFETEKLFKSHC